MSERPRTLQLGKKLDRLPTDVRLTELSASISRQLGEVWGITRKGRTFTITKNGMTVYEGTRVLHNVLLELTGVTAVVNEIGFGEN